MRVIELGAGMHWKVYATCDRGGDCAVLDLILELGDRGSRILADLQRYIPESRQEEWARTRFSAPLANGILEFRWPTRGGGTPRVLWFFQPGKIVVCAAVEHRTLKVVRFEDC